MEQCPDEEDGECGFFLFPANSGHCDGNLSKFSSWDHCASNIGRCVGHAQTLSSSGSSVFYVTGSRLAFHLFL